MKTITGSKIIWAAAFVLCAALLAMADDDPPGRVARLQYVTGAISVQPGGVKDWVEASVNRPLTTADRVWADKDSRAELHLGSAVLRMNAETSATLTNVSDNIVQVELDQGTLNLRVRRLYDGETYEIDTPNLAFTILKSGEYRFDVDPNNDITFVTVWRGEGEATGEGRSVRIRSGHQAKFTEGTSLASSIQGEPEMDGFDDWCEVRNKREDTSVSARYVSPDVIGAADLDQYGTWRVVPTYGAVWVPAVAPGWAPYRYGHWVWIDPWGWTWVDDAPWGFAPCHYGRWVYYGGFWAWSPGPIRVRPVYAPALVAWVGGRHWGVSVSFGSGGGVGWFPLGYGEPYVPAYRASRRYFENVNVSNTRIVNITNVTNNYYTTNVTNTTIINQKIVYKNQTINGAVTAVPRTVLTNAQPVGRAAVRVEAHEMRGIAPLSTPDVAPSKASVLGMRGGATTLPPAVMARQRVYVRNAPPEKPIPFAAKQEALAAHPGRPLDRDAERDLRRRVLHEPVRMAEPAERATPVRAPESAGQPADRSPAMRPSPAAPVNEKVVTKPQDRMPAVQPVTARPIDTPTTPAPAVAERPARPVRNVPHPPVRDAGFDNPRKPTLPGVQQGSQNRPDNRDNAPAAPVADDKPAVFAPTAPVHNVPRPPVRDSGFDNPRRGREQAPSQKPDTQDRADNDHGNKMAPRAVLDEKPAPVNPAPAVMDRSPRPAREVSDRPESSPRPQVEQARPQVVERPAPRSDSQPVRVQEQPRRKVRQNVDNAPRPQVEQARPQVVERPAPRPDPQPVRMQEQPRREVRQNVESPRSQQSSPAPSAHQGNSRGEGQRAARPSEARHDEDKKK